MTPSIPVPATTSNLRQELSRLIDEARRQLHAVTKAPELAAPAPQELATLVALKAFLFGVTCAKSDVLTDGRELRLKSVFAAEARQILEHAAPTRRA